MELTRHQLREAAFQTNFSMLYDENLTTNDAIKNVLALYGKQDEIQVPTYLEFLVVGVKENQQELDSLIEKHLKRWTVKRIAKTDLVILRLTLFEMLYVYEVPEKVSLNEALEIAKKFSDDDSRRFINGVLSSVMNNLNSGE